MDSSNPNPDRPYIQMKEESVWLFTGGGRFMTPLTPDEAWDLGDDLLIAADRIMMARDGWEEGVVEPPQWLTKIHLDTEDGFSGLWCDVCQTHLRDTIPWTEVYRIMDAARNHWTARHTQEVTDEERPDGRPDEEVRGSDEAAPAAPDVHDPAA
jgi:hypothetical protein